MIKAVLFDFDGVIHDTYDYSVQLNKIINPKMTQEEHLSIFDGNFYEDKTTPEEDYNIFFEMNAKIFENLKIESKIKEELEKLAKNYPLFIVTSNTEKILEKYFKDNGIRHLVREILGAETHKSKVEKFKMILKKHQLKEDEVIFVTDTLGDLLEANKLNIKSLAVDFGYHDKDRLEKGSPLRIISNFNEIAIFLEKQKSNNL